MGVIHRFLATEDEACLIPEWFRSQSHEPIERTEHGNSLFYFEAFGPPSDNAKESPLVNVFTPLRKRDVLLTCGEVHFLATPLSLFPQLAALNRAFRAWLSQFTRVFSRRKDFEPEWNYYLEGGIQNRDADVHALPNAMRLLRQGRYFVAMDDNDCVLEKVCRELRKRGVPGVS